MIKTIAYFPLQCARNSGEVMAAVRGSLNQHGIEIRPQNWESDAVIIWSVLFHGRMQENQQVYNHYRDLGRPVIIIDVGTLIRGVTWKVAVNNITADGHYGHEHNLDWDRPRRLGIGLQNQTLRPEILIAAQHQQSLQMSKVPDQEALITQQIAQIRSTTDRPIVVRSHPRCALNISQLPLGIEIQAPQRLVNTYDSYDMTVNYRAVVNHNSGPGIQAALAGARPIVDRSSLAAPVSIDISCIEKPYAVDREQWLVEIAHTEYTIPELEAGLWIQRLEPYL